MGPGWYDDPGGSSQKRFWDGKQWTSALQGISSPADSTPGASRRRASRTLVAIGVLAVMGIGVVVGLTIAGNGDGGTTDTPLSEPAPDGTVPDSDPTQDQPDGLDQGDPFAVTGDLAILDLVARTSLPTDTSGMVLFIDIDGLTEAGLISPTGAEPDGWYGVSEVRSISIFPDPYYMFASLSRPVPMESVLGLSFNEIGGSVRTFDETPAQLLPRIAPSELEARLDDSAVWDRQPGEGADYQRTRTWDTSDLGGYEPDNIEARGLEGAPERVAISDGVFILDPADGGDPLGEDPAGRRLLDVLAGEGALHGIIASHEPGLAEVPEGNLSLEPAAAMALIARIRNGEVINQVHLEYPSLDAAERNAASFRTNLEASGDFSGEVTVEGTHVWAHVESTHDEREPIHDIFQDIRRIPSPGTHFELIATNR